MGSYTVTQSNFWPVPKIPSVSTLPTVFPRLDHGLQRAADQVVRRLLQRKVGLAGFNTPNTLVIGSTKDAVFHTPIIPILHISQWHSDGIR